MDQVHTKQSALDEEMDIKQTGSAALKMRRACCFFSKHPLRIHTVKRCFFVNMYYSQPILLAKSNIAKQNFCQFFNVVSDGSPSRIRRVRRISLGMTTLPRSSILRTIPVAFISESPLVTISRYSYGSCRIIVCRYAGFIQKTARKNLSETKHGVDTCEQGKTAAVGERRFSYKELDTDADHKK